MKGRILVVGTCLMFRPMLAAHAQGGLADSTLDGFRRWVDSVDVPLHLRLNSSCLVKSDSRYSSCIVSDVSIPSPGLSLDSGRMMPFRHFGSLFARLGPPKTAEHIDRVDSIGIIVGGWHGLVEAHHLPARRDVGFSLAAEEADAASPASLALRCRNGVIDAALHTQQPLGGVSTRAVTLRFGSEAPRRERWLRGRDSTALHVPGDQRHVRAFLDEAGAHEVLAIDVARSRVAPPSVFTFNLVGISVVVTQLESACR